MQHFKAYSKQDILSRTTLRRFETKLGEKVSVPENIHNLEESLQQSSARFVIIGIPEDAGVRANNGIAGAATAWPQFLDAFVNVQSNDFLEGSNILICGHFDFNKETQIIENNAENEEEKIAAYSHLCNTIDDEVSDLIKIICQFNKIPIVIGGGHNNAYGCIKGAARGLYKAGLIPLAQINAINLDAHTDFRPVEGRHSGNGFRYADEDGYLEKYCVIGLHENYMTQNVWIDIVNDPFKDVITFEDIFIHEKKSFIGAVTHAVGFTQNSYCGVELDLDSIENVLSSALTPAGITALHARQYINFAASNTRPAYVHICEGAAELSDGRSSKTTGKLISYLVSDFIKAAL